MAVARDSPQVGGYEAQFVSPLDQDLQCPVCHRVVQQPVRASCGHLMCSACVQAITENDTFTCPLDKKVMEKDEAFPDRTHEEKILSLTVKCDHQSEGCTWEGQLRNLQEHMSENGDCPCVYVTCQFAEVGCTHAGKKTDLDEHIRNDVQNHTLLLLDRVKALEEENKQLKSQYTTTAAQGKETEVSLDRAASLERDYEQLKAQGPTKSAHLKTGCIQASSESCKFVWTVNNWAQVLRDAKEGKQVTIYSYPFYTGYRARGYTLCLTAYPNGHGSGSGEYLSLYLCLMRGPYDELLTWPFQYKYTISLIDQQLDGTDVSHQLDPAQMNEKDLQCFAKPTSQVNPAGGWGRFVSHRRLETRSYVKNDRILLELEMHSHQQ